MIPLEIRRKMGINPGDRLVIVGGEDAAILMKPRRYAESLRGIAGGVYGRTREEIDAYVHGERQAWEMSGRTRSSSWKVPNRRNPNSHAGAT